MSVMLFSKHLHSLGPSCAHFTPLIIPLYVWPWNPVKNNNTFLGDCGRLSFTKTGRRPGSRNTYRVRSVVTRERPGIVNTCTILTKRCLFVMDLFSATQTQKQKQKKSWPKVPRHWTYCKMIPFSGGPEPYSVSVVHFFWESFLSLFFMWGL